VDELDLLALEERQAFQEIFCGLFISSFACSAAAELLEQLILLAQHDVASVRLALLFCLLGAGFLLLSWSAGILVGEQDTVECVKDGRLLECLNRSNSTLRMAHP